MKTKKIMAGLALLSMLVFTGQSCTRSSSREAELAYQPITLEYWTVFNDSSDYREVIANYQLIHPNIRVNVKKFRFEEYEQELLDALAEDRGPDIFSVHNTWVPSYRTKLFPLPAQTTLAYQYVTGTVNKETVTELRSTISLTEFDLRSQFVEQVYKDVYINEKTLVDGEETFGDPVIYGLPAALDSMVLYYNRDLLDNAGIAQPAPTWDEFQEQTTELARFDSQENILLAGAAMGTANNVPRATDILSLLMMQNGAEMIEGGQVLFHRLPSSLRGVRSTIPGEDALRFYTSFANSNNRNYTWNEDQPDGFEAFLQGKSAYFFGYSYHVEQIEGLAPQLNYGVANMPQIAGNTPTHFANYWVESVSRKTENYNAAWDFVQFLTSAEQSQAFLERVKRPTARRDLIEWQAQDPDMFIFASQVLNSQSWYNGNDPGAAEQIMRDLITEQLAETNDIDELIELAAQRVQQTLR